MFTKIAFVFLTISLIGMVKGDFSSNVNEIVKNLRRVNCMTETVLELEDQADEFSYQIKRKCHRAVDLAKELADVKQLTDITSSVININDGDCNNAGYDDDWDATTTPPAKCVQNLKTQLALLLTSFTQTSTDINNGLLESYSTNSCVQITMTNFKYYLDTFELRITRCAGLA